MSDAVVTDVKVTREARTERWHGVVAQWQESGQSRAAFCREQSLSLWVSVISAPSIARGRDGLQWGACR